MGLGFSHTRLLTWSPSPQVAEHACQELHADQLPFTVEKHETSSSSVLVAFIPSVLFLWIQSAQKSRWVDALRDNKMIGYTNLRDLRCQQISGYTTIHVRVFPNSLCNSGKTPKFGILERKSGTKTNCKIWVSHWSCALLFNKETKLCLIKARTLGVGTEVTQETWGGIHLSREGFGHIGWTHQDSHLGYMTKFDEPVPGTVGHHWTVQDCYRTVVFLELLVHKTSNRWSSYPMRSTPRQLWKHQTIWVGTTSWI